MKLMRHDEWRAFLLARPPRTAKVATVRADGRPPFGFVLIEGTARISDNLDEVRAWATRIAGRYMGVMRAKAYGARNGIPGELLVRVTSSRVIAQSGIAE